MTRISELPAPEPEEEPEPLTIAGSIKAGELVINSAVGGLTISGDGSARISSSVMPSPGIVPGGGLVPGAPVHTWPSTGTGPTLYPDEAAELAKEEAERTAELVVLPTKRPRKVLVAFFDDEDEESNEHEPFWAAFLEPEDMDLLLAPKDSRDAAMCLRLALRKRFPQ